MPDETIKQFKKAQEERAHKMGELEIKSKEKIVEDKAKKLGLEYSDLTGQTFNLKALALISEDNAKAAGITAYQQIENTLFIALIDPENKQARAILEKLGKKYKLRLYLISRRSLDWILLNYKKLPKKATSGLGILTIDQKRLKHFQEKIKNLSDVKIELKGLTATNIGISLEMILAASLAIDASDIHLEPTEKAGTLKFRIDGMLQEVADLNRKVYEFLINRIKLISGLRLNVTDIPQDGRLTIRTEEADIEIRTSILPGPNGENSVMRVLNPKTIGLKLEDLGFQSFHSEIINQELERPNGMILVTGPTGSGKTTTLYAFLKKKVNEPGLKIITLEDPIEYHLTRIEQTQVEPEKGFDFASGLRSVLRQDPDVVLVGEIRDLETVQTALHASLTGHLVFSTLHTNDAPGIIPRLIDLGASPAIIAPAINIGLAQRLVRKVCKACSGKKHASAEEAKKIKTLTESIPPQIKAKVKIPTIDEKLMIPDVKGCPKCNETGYKGRIGIFEIFQIDDEMERLILAKPTEIEVKELARKNGMINMKEDGALKVLSGLTTLKELERITGE
jgi:type IV pilus assembly protein PilB